MGNLFNGITLKGLLEILNKVWRDEKVLGEISEIRYE